MHVGVLSEKLNYLVVGFDQQVMQEGVLRQKLCHCLGVCNLIKTLQCDTGKSKCRHRYVSRTRDIQKCVRTFLSVSANKGPIWPMTNYARRRRRVPPCKSM